MQGCQNLRSTQVRTPKKQRALKKNKGRFAKNNELVKKNNEKK